MALSRSRLVAATMRASVFSTRVPPSRWNSRSCSTRRNLACADEAHLADFVEKQHAAGRLLELAGLALRRAGERATLVAEQLRLEQLFRQARRSSARRTGRPPRRRAMDEPRDHLLPGARLAKQQHGRFGRRDLCRLRSAPAATMAHCRRCGGRPDRALSSSVSARTRASRTTRSRGRLAARLDASAPRPRVRLSATSIADASRDEQVGLFVCGGSEREEHNGPEEFLAEANRHAESRAVASLCRFPVLPDGVMLQVVGEHLVPLPLFDEGLGNLEHLGKRLRAMTGAGVDPCVAAVRQHDGEDHHVVRQDLARDRRHAVEDLGQVGRIDQLAQQLVEQFERCRSRPKFLGCRA